MPAYFNLIEKIIMKGFNLGPAPMADIAGGFSFFAVDAAVRLNLFEKLAEKPSTAESLAGLCGCDGRGLVTLLDVLETLGYVKLKNSIYSVTRMTRKWMMDSSDISFKLGFEYYAPAISEIWPHLSDSVRAGHPHTHFYEWLKDRPRTAEVYQKYMMSLAAIMIPEIVDKIALKETRILDIGGSHGMYSIALCRKYPLISVIIIDSAYAMPLLKKNIAEAGLEHRISLVTGDLMDHRFDEKFDAALLFNVLHEHEEEYNKKILTRAAGVLTPGGRLIVLESVKHKSISPMADLMERTYGLMFFHFLGGQNYTFAEIKNMMLGCGFSKVKRIRMLSMFSLINAYH